MNFAEVSTGITGRLLQMVQSLTWHTLSVVVVLLSTATIQTVHRYVVFVASPTLPIPHIFPLDTSVFFLRYSLEKLSFSRGFFVWEEGAIFLFLHIKYKDIYGCEKEFFC